jgi:hypothetical protein
VLTITNWQGVANQQSELTKLLFGTGGLTSTQLGQVRFADQNIDGGQLLGAQGELAPIPEAPVFWGAAAVALFILWRERRRLVGRHGIHTREQIRSAGLPGLLAGARNCGPKTSEESLSGWNRNQEPFTRPR